MEHDVSELERRVHDLEQDIEEVLVLLEAIAAALGLPGWLDDGGALEPLEAWAARIRSEVKKP